MEDSNQLAVKVVGRMYENDAFSQWLGIERVSVTPGGCMLRMVVRREMLNGFSIAHGGITYSLADSALAFASNGHGRMSVSVETSISHTHPVKEGDVLTAVATELNCTDKVALYDVKVTNQEDKPVAFFKGTVYRTPKSWFPEHD